MSDKLIGKILGDFRLEERIGKGGLGRVYRATELSLGRVVAVKVLEESFFTPEEMKERFRREVRFIAGLEHPHIVPIYAGGQEGPFSFFAMPYLPEGTLADRIAQGLPVREGIRYCAEVCAALGYAHDREIVHRDVKPANIMIGAGSAMLSDFGWARFLETETITASHAYIGTPLYFSPEQARRERVTPRSDIFALGVILYEIAAGRHPFAAARSFEEQAARIADVRFEPPRGVCPEMDEAVEEVILTAMRGDPGERFASAREMRRALEALR